MRILFNLKDGSRVDEVVEEISMRFLAKSLNEKEFVLVNNTIVKCSEVKSIRLIKEDNPS